MKFFFAVFKHIRVIWLWHFRFSCQDWSSCRHFMLRFPTKIIYYIYISYIYDSILQFENMSTILIIMLILELSTE